MKVFSADRLEFPQAVNSRFPVAKYRMLRERLEIDPQLEMLEPPPVTDQDLRLAHSERYVRKVILGELDRLEQRRIGFPWSPELVERSRRSVGATLEAARWALRDGAAASLQGGTHHAFADHGEGYCVFNDSVVALRCLQQEGLIRRAAVLDCDVHQGNGTASILRNDPDLFCFSIHGANNFPFRKEQSHLDVALPDGTGDEAYLAALAPALEVALASRPELAIYLAGADPFVGDSLGRLALSKAGLERRDRFVLDLLRTRGIPVAVTMAGGYASRIEDTVEIQSRSVILTTANLRRPRS